MRLSDAEAIARAEMKRWGIAGEVSFGFDNAVRRMGCYHIKKKRITLSRPITLLNDEERVKNTILHEIAHALAEKERPSSGHNYFWKIKARMVGCDAERTCGSDQVVAPPSRGVMVCLSCNMQSPVYRRPAKPVKKACRHCCNKYAGGRYNEKYALQYMEKTE